MLSFCSDLICLMFLPVHWLFFAASTYVWVQFVWHTGKYLTAKICRKTGVLKNPLEEDITVCILLYVKHLGPRYEIKMK